ncbi:hypothetical protein, partial [Brevundimonas sp.]|uniref:hypothetical protein n=1 Tax=Brevundimonas sp. TaxID=1871086 RepID=UPI0035B22AD5
MSTTDMAKLRGSGVGGACLNKRAPRGEVPGPAGVECLAPAEIREKLDCGDIVLTPGRLRFGAHRLQPGQLGLHRLELGRQLAAGEDVGGEAEGPLAQEELHLRQPGLALGLLLGDIDLGVVEAVVETGDLGGGAGQPQGLQPLAGLQRRHRPGQTLAGHVGGAEARRLAPGLEQFGLGPGGGVGRLLRRRRDGGGGALAGRAHPRRRPGGEGALGPAL